MADNVSTETPSSEPAELSFETAVSMLDDEEGQPSDALETVEQKQETTKDEAAETVEDDAAEPEEVDASQEDAEPETKDDVLIKMDDGSTVTVAELKAEAVNLKTENARISQEVATERRELQQMGKSVAETYDSVLNYLASKLPPEPDANMLWSDPTRHHQMTFMRHTAIQELQSLLQAKQGVDDATSQLSELDFKKYEAEEKAKLIAAVPNLKDPARFKAAMDKVKAYATSIGFSPEKVDMTKDSLILQMAIDAAYGREARKAAQQAKVQVKTAVAKSPVAQRTAHPNSLKAIGHVNALRALKTSGSLKDAMKLDFE